MKIQLSQKVCWQKEGVNQVYDWFSEAGLPAPQDLVFADDNSSANQLIRYALEGKGIIWQGDYPNARHMLSALVRRANRSDRNSQAKTPKNPEEIFFHHREKQKYRAELLAKFLVPISKDFEIQLPRAQEVKSALALVLEKPEEDFLMSLRGLLAIIGAYEWYKKGILVPFLNRKMTPYFGVFSPARSEYIELVATHEMPISTQTAIEVGVGSGVLSAVLAKRGVQRILATDIDPRAIDCARNNIASLGYSHQVTIMQQSLFPNEEKVDLIVCNPPWVPAKPSSPIEFAVFDENSQFLRNFLYQCANHLKPHGRVWLILSDLAEHLHLRSRQELLEWFKEGKLAVVSKQDTKPHHPKTRNNDDPLFFARSKEVTSLWELKAI